MMRETLEETLTEQGHELLLYQRSASSYVMAVGETTSGRFQTHVAVVGCDYEKALINLNSRYRRWLEKCNND